MDYKNVTYSLVGKVGTVQELGVLALYIIVPTVKFGDLKPYQTMCRYTFVLIFSTITIP